MISFGSTTPSQVFGNETFDRTFLKGIRSCRSSLLIETPPCLFAPKPGTILVLSYIHCARRQFLETLQHT